MVLTIFSPQPKKGILNSSRLATNTCGGKISCRASVSQPLWCLAQMMDGLSGMFSAPTSRYFKPTMFFSDHIRIFTHCRATACAPLGIGMARIMKGNMVIRLTTNISQ